MGPPMLPPKSFSLIMFLGSRLALLIQVLAFKAVLRKSSKSRPWKELVPRRVTRLIWSDGRSRAAAQIHLACLNSHLGDVLETGLNHYRAVREAGALEPVADSGNTIECRAYNRASGEVVESATSRDGVVLRSLRERGLANDSQRSG